MLKGADCWHSLLLAVSFAQASVRLAQVCLCKVLLTKEEQIYLLLLAKKL